MWCAGVGKGSKGKTGGWVRGQKRYLGKEKAGVMDEVCKGRWVREKGKGDQEGVIVRKGAWERDKIG